MTSCKDCLHYSVCEFFDDKEYDGEQAIREDCEYFKSTADVVPREEIAKIFEEIEKIITEPFTAGFNLLMPINQALCEYTDSFRTELLYYVAELKEKHTKGGAE